MKKSELKELIKEILLKEGKSDTFTDFEDLIDNYNISAEKLLHYVFDFFPGDFKEFYNHCAEEVGAGEVDED